MYTNVNHASFTVSSVEKAAEFYVRSLGMKLIDISEREVAFGERVTGIPGASMRIAYVSAADFKIELIEYLTSRGEKLNTRTCNIGSAHICFNVDDTGRHVRGNVGKRGEVHFFTVNDSRRPESGREGGLP